jgi:hypothetical protein
MYIRIGTKFGKTSTVKRLEHLMTAEEADLNELTKSVDGSGIFKSAKLSSTDFVERVAARVAAVNFERDIVRA